VAILRGRPVADARFNLQLLREIEIVTAARAVHG
jgi:hypothetical protein